MGLNDTPSAERTHIGFFGLRNAGKSSIVNAIASQQVSLVSGTKGTTTDPVRKAMEILPLGPVILVDTAGFDDTGDLGELRVERTRQILHQMDIVVLVLDARNASLLEEEKQFMQEVHRRKLPLLLLVNHCDEAIPKFLPLPGEQVLLLSATAGSAPVELDQHTLHKLQGKWTDMHGIRETLAHMKPAGEKLLIMDRLQPGSRVMLVIPVDESAPKGRIILPQQLVLRELLDYHCQILCCQPEEVAVVLDGLKEPPDLVITDSQAFEQVSQDVPTSISLTSFSILMARYKGNLSAMLEGVAAIRQLRDGDAVLIAEGCTHHRQCNDIGTVKMPGWIRKFTGATPRYTFTSGGAFPEDLSEYKLVVHCGGCMLNEKEMRYRVAQCKGACTPIVNYGMAIAAMHGILDRSLEILGSQQG